MYNIDYKEQLKIESATEIVSSWLASPVLKLAEGDNLTKLVEEAIVILREFYQK